MADLPDDLTSVGRHHGNEPPTETGQEVRSPSGPDPHSQPATPSPGLFQLVRDEKNDRIQIRVHSARAEVSAPEDEETEEIGQYRTVDALRSALNEAGIRGRTAIFEDAEAGKVLTDTDITSSHTWIGQPRYQRITFVSDDAAVSDYVSGLDQPLA